MPARTLFRAFAALALATASLAAQSNVLVVMADDLGTDAVGCYGLGLRSVPTPNIDALAQNGVRFTRAYMNPACSPTRGCIMTGRYGFRTGVPTTVGNNEPGLNQNEMTLAQALTIAAPGYAKAMVGKWHLGMLAGAASPNLRGWPHFSGILEGGVGDYYHWVKTVDGQQSVSTNYLATDQVDDGLAWINAQTQPWMLLMSLCSPHGPYQAPPAHLHTRNLAGFDPRTQTRPFYEAMVEAFDTELGRLLNSMSPAVRANTNILFFGDNGTDSAQTIPPFDATRLKGSLYEGGFRVPMIASGPAVANPGRTSAALVSAVDVFTTVLDLCGAAPASLPPSPAGPRDGVSFRPILANTATSVRSYVYADMLYSQFGGGYVVVDDTHALLRVQYFAPQRQELYDVVADPLQTNDLLAGARSARDEAAYQRLLGILASLRNDGWVENLGTGCSSLAVPTPTLRSQSFPTIGQLYVTQVGGLSPTAARLWIAVGRPGQVDPVLGTLPASLTSLGMTGCMAQTFGDVLWAPYPNPQPFGGFVYVPVPPLLELAGTHLHFQVFVEDPQANPLGLLGSNGQHCVIGL